MAWCLLAGSVQSCVVSPALRWQGGCREEGGTQAQLKDSRFPICRGGVYLQRDWWAVPGSCVEVERCHSTVICDVRFDKPTPHEPYHKINFPVFHTSSIVILNLNLMTTRWGRKAEVRYFFQCHTQNLPLSDQHRPSSVGHLQTSVWPQADRTV